MKEGTRHEMGELRVLFADRSLIVADKPSGLSVHRGYDRSRDNVLARLEGVGLGPVHPVHRLDRAVSGVMVLARSADSARELAAQFEARTVLKAYVAMVRGLAPEAVVVEHPVPKDEGGERVPATTEIERLSSALVPPELAPPEGLSMVSLVRARPRTGRFHQIRRHCKHIGHPLIGDANYGRGRINRWASSALGIGRLALHAVTIGFVHPATGELMRFESPLPEEWSRAPIRFTD